jgi:hypothetical protein
MEHRVINHFGIITDYATKHKLTITPAQYTQLADYLTLLQEWNKDKVNLTAIVDPTEMVRKHLLDALTYMPLNPKPPARLIDVGSGGGIPGIVLAIVCAKHTSRWWKVSPKKLRSWCMWLHILRCQMCISSASGRNARPGQTIPRPVRHGHGTRRSRIARPCRVFVAARAHRGKVYAPKGRRRRSKSKPPKQPLPRLVVIYTTS